ncbi:hypothetical protein [Paraburkholderia atlantica]|uniref:hypothetical protein n=1 Tax=Paraburkholderia atlantica TaxID=2654982 RepID=UPI001615CEA6|nr:hypothetical protein [Paraburkholderia atlantica]MBB5509533.1 topoisomerase IA-like protein [Paraburkholderia atlantica]
MKNEQQDVAGIQYDEMIKLLREMNQRATRTESRVVHLGDHVGANLRTRMRIEIKRDRDAPYVEIDALDVSISRIVAVLVDRGIDEAIDVYLKNERVATVYPENA